MTKIALITFQLLSPFLAFAWMSAVERMTSGTWWKRWRWNLFISFVVMALTQLVVYLARRIDTL